MSYVNGKVIKNFRERQKLTQKQLGELLCVSDKTISKWESGRGLPDISLLPELASALHVSMPELFAGEQIVNRNRSANMKKVSFYVCPICGNIIQAAGEGVYSCCGVLLPLLEAEEADQGHEIRTELVENEYYVTVQHPMCKEHYLSFMAYVTLDCVQMVKLYPEQEARARFVRRGSGMLYLYCNRHGLYSKKM